MSIKRPAADAAPLAVPGERDKQRLGPCRRGRALDPKWVESQGITLMLLNPREPSVSKRWKRE